MKKLISILSVAVLTTALFFSCDKVTSNDYSGTYAGSLSTVGDAAKTKDNVKILITNNPLDETQLYMDGLLLTKNSDTKYSISGTQLLTMIQILFPSVSNEQVENATCNLEFSKNSLDLELNYKLVGIANLTIIKYSGKKEKK